MRYIVVISLSKIKISKAIHNFINEGQNIKWVVISLSKIKISKAIHNPLERLVCELRLLSVCQR